MSLNALSKGPIKSLLKISFHIHFKENITKCLNQRRKLRTYAQFKSAMKFEKYLESVQNFSIRRSFSRFHLGVHDLEDDKHLMQCPAYSSQRTIMMNKLTQKFPNLALFDESEQFVWMVSQDDSESIKYVSNFIFSPMKERRKVLELLLLTSKKKK